MKITPFSPEMGLELWKDAQIYLQSKQDFFLWDSCELSQVYRRKFSTYTQLFIGCIITLCILPQFLLHVMIYISSCILFHFMQDATIDARNGRVENCQFTVSGSQWQHRHIEHKLQHLQQSLIGIYSHSNPLQGTV